MDINDNGDIVFPFFLDSGVNGIGIASPATFGDADLDGDVDLADLGVLATNYEQPRELDWQHGDFDGDGDVDLADLGALATNYAAGEAQAVSDFAALTGVPEPAASFIWLLAIASFIGKRRVAEVG